MRGIIVAGGRDFADRDRLFKILADFVSVRDIIHEGGCPTGADAMAREWATKWGIHRVSHPADWEQHGRAAGPIRNREMAKMGDVLIAFWDGKSPGTRSMINEALAAGLEVHVYSY